MRTPTRKHVRKTDHPSVSGRAKIELGASEVREVAFAVAYYYSDLASVEGHEKQLKRLETAQAKLNNALRSWGMPEVSLDDS